MTPDIDTYHHFTESDADRTSAVRRYTEDSIETVAFGDNAPDEDYVERECDYSLIEHCAECSERLEEDPEVFDGVETRYHLETVFEEAPDWFIEHFETRTFKHTDPWRGYFETPHDLKKISVGWVTGWASEDDHAHKLDAIELRERLDEGEFIPPAPLYWLVEPTSNVFSQASELLVAEKDYEVVTAWLREIGFPVETVERAFS